MNNNKQTYMDLSQLPLDAALIAASAIVSAFTSSKVTSAVMNEKLQNIKNEFDDHKKSYGEEIMKIKGEINESMSGCRVNHKDRLDGLNEYIKRVEANKADKSEVNMIIDTTKRIEQKLDLLILREK